VVSILRKYVLQTDSGWQIYPIESFLIFRITLLAIPRNLPFSSFLKWFIMIHVSGGMPDRFNAIP